jgi:Ni/Co efflux regulator RcnB
MRINTTKAILAAAALALLVPSHAVARGDDRDTETSERDRDRDRGRDRDRDRDDDGGFPWGLLGLLGLGGLAGLTALRKKPDLHVDARHNPPHL